MKRPETLKMFRDFKNLYAATKSSGECGVVLRALQYLRSSQAPDAINLLEIGLDSSIITLAGFYGELPEAQRARIDLEPMRVARDYRAKYPSDKTSTSVDLKAALVKAYEILDADSPPAER